MKDMILGYLEELGFSEKWENLISIHCFDSEEMVDGENYYSVALLKDCDHNYFVDILKMEYSSNDYSPIYFLSEEINHDYNKYHCDDEFELSKESFSIIVNNLLEMENLDDLAN